MHKGGGMEGGLTCGVAAVVGKGETSAGSSHPSFDTSPRRAH